jgi:hypothetical protein
MPMCPRFMPPAACDLTNSHFAQVCVCWRKACCCFGHKARPGDAAADPTAEGVGVARTSSQSSLTRTPSMANRTGIHLTFKYPPVLVGKVSVWPRWPRLICLHFRCDVSG